MHSGSGKRGFKSKEGNHEGRDQEERAAVSYLKIGVRGRSKYQQVHLSLDRYI